MPTATASDKYVKGQELIDALCIASSFGKAIPVADSIVKRVEKGEDLPSSIRQAFAECQIPPK